MKTRGFFDQGAQFRGARRALDTGTILVLALMLCLENASAADARDARVEAIALRWKQIEGQLQRAVYYVTEETLTAGEVKRDEAWSHETGDLLKLSSERSGEAGRRLTEIFYNVAGWVIFVFTRAETPLANGGTKIEEERLYFGGEDQRLIRHLSKTANFKPGEPLETSKVLNVARSLTERPKDLNDESRTSYDQLAAEIWESLRAKAPARDPRKDAGGDSGAFRLIQESASPDGRYALAIGLGRKDIDWAQYAEDVDGKDVSTIEPRDAADLQNYLVDLDTHRILGETGCQYFGTRTSYNHSSCSVFWSPDSTTFVQLTHEKWQYLACRAGRITEGPKLAGTVDLGAEAEKSAVAFLRAKKDRAFRKHGNEMQTAMEVESLTNDGVINISVAGQVPKSDERDHHFKLTERLRLRITPAGLRLETLEVRYAPNE